MRRKKRLSMVELGMRNGGIRSTVKALTYAQSWCTAWASLGHEPNMEEYGEWWRQSPASAYRERDAWRKCFPDESVSEFVVRTGLLERNEAVVEAWRAMGDETGSPAKREKAFAPLLAGLMTMEGPG